MRPESESHVRHQLGAYALGHLSPAEVAAVEAHLEGCAACRREALELEIVAAALPLVDAGRLGAQRPPPPDLLDGVFVRIRAERLEQRRRRRRRSGAALLGAAAAIMTAVMVFVSPFSPGGVVVALEAERPGVSGEATVYAGEDRTWVELNATGLPQGETFAMWVRDRRTAKPVRCGTFTVPPGELHIALYSTVTRDRASGVGVSTLEGEVVMQADLPVAG